MKSIFDDDILDSSSDKDLECAIILNMNEHSTSQNPLIHSRVFINRDTIGGHNRLYQDYFADNAIYSLKLFRRRFRMQSELFIRIQNEVVAHDDYFVQKRNAAGKLGLSSIQKTTVALQMLAYGITGDFTDEYIRIGETTAIESMKRFVKAIVEIFADQYLRKPNNEDLIRLLDKANQRGTPCMLGSVDCMHWVWKNCPTQWSGMYSGRSGKPTIILEVVASYDTWIWHAFFGLPGSHNDINILERSSVFDDIAKGDAPKVHYSINGHEYNMGYYLADGIYPNWATFVKSILASIGNKKKHFASVHETLRKDVERAFGILQSRFAIIRGPARYFDKDNLKIIMMACIIMHNMIVENERDMDQEAEEFYKYEQENYSTPQSTISTSRTDEVNNFIMQHEKIRDSSINKQLQEDLIEHLWSLYSES